MVLLAVDTSGREGSLALARVTAGRADVEVVEIVSLAGGTFSAQLVPQIKTLLEKHGQSKSDIAGFVVVSGPGSFTGLRVGLAAIKGLAEILQKPIAAVSMLEALARKSATSGCVLSVLDAGRGEVYVGDYEIGPAVRMVSERLLSRELLLGSDKSSSVITPDAELTEAARRAGFRVALTDRPSSGDVARLGWERIQRGETVRAEDLEANYIRRSDAEIFSKPKL